MKALIPVLALVLMLGMTVPGVAQSPSPAAPVTNAPPSPEKMKAFMKELNLSPPQAIRIGGILKEAKDKQKDPQETLKQVMSVLSKEQQAKLQALIQQMPGSSPSP